MSTNHILPLPKAIFALRIIQLVVAVAVLGLCGYIVTFLAFDAACLTLFSAIATIIISVYDIVASTGFKAAYNYWAMLALDIFAIIFWIISMSYLAWTTAYATYWYTNSYDDYSCSNYWYCYKKRDIPLVSRAVTDAYTYRNSMAAAAGLGGLQVILFAITLTFTAVYLHRHRKAGGNSMPCREEGAPAPTVAQVPNAEWQGTHSEQQQLP